MIYEVDDYRDEYDKSSEGKKQIAEYERQQDIMWNSPNWSEKSQRDFRKAEETYLRSREAYAAKKLVDRHGQEIADRWANAGLVDTGKDAISVMSDEWWVYAI